jgi:hypothetical protein
MIARVIVTVLATMTVALVVCSGGEDRSLAGTTWRVTALRDAAGSSGRMSARPHG